MNKEKKQSILFSLIRSIKDFDYYKQISIEKFSKSFLYLFVLIFIYSIVTTIGLIREFNQNIDEIKLFINTEINSLTYSNGILTINEDNYKEYYNNYLIIDTSKDINDENEKKSNIVIGKQYLSLKLENVVFKFRYNDYFYEDINKESLLQMLSNKKSSYTIMIILVTFISAVIILTISTFLDVLIIGLIGCVISKIIGNRELKFTNMFKIAIHAITLPVILGMIYYLINTFLGFYIKYFSIMYTSIATIYVITAVLLITYDSNKENKSIM